MLVKRVRDSKEKNEEAGDLKLVESLWIGKGQRVMLLNVAGQQVLLGASGGSIQSLAVLNDDKAAAVPEEKAANDDYFPSMLRSEMKDPEPAKPTYGRTGRLETRDEETKPAPQVSNERVKQILKRLNHL
jgi:flagellar biogenesis protein FliO